MKIIILLSLACTVFASLQEDGEQWAIFKSKHGKLYQNGQEEEMRFSVFQENLRQIEEHNKQFKAGNTTYTKGINRFADFTKDEIVSMLRRQSAKHSRLERDSVYKAPAGLTVPSSIDWRQEGAVTGVKDQGNCGSCYAFATTGVLEAYYYLKNQQLLSFSEQQIVDCEPYGDCSKGGDQGIALYYVKDSGIQTENTYPYEAQDNTCRFNQAEAANLQINEVIMLKEKHEEDLLNAVGSVGPLSVSIYATELVFYEAGVFSSEACSKTELNHAVLTVGYGEENGVDYWIIKNSWGADWGENGYFRLRRGTDECGVSSECHYITLK